MGTLKRRGQIAMGLAVIACGAWAVDASAATITLKRDSNDWNLGSDWSDGHTPSAGSDYLNSSYVLRTKEVSSSTFSGGSLTIGSSGTLALKATTQAANNLTLVAGSGSGATIVNYLNAGKVTLAGSMAISGTGNVTINANQSNRNITVSAPITGTVGQTINIHAASGGQVKISSSGNAFTGAWSVSGILEGIADGSLGSGDFTVNAGGSLDFDYDATANSLTLLGSTGALLVNQSGLDLTFNAATIGGNALAAGTYTFSDLATTYGTGLIKISNGGTGTLTVVPEPASVAVLVGLGALGMLKRKRRAANA